MNATYQAIRDWLSAIPSSLNPAEIRRGYLPYTKNKLKQYVRQGRRLPPTMVRSLDPDSIFRPNEQDGQTGAELEPEDLAYERALLRSLFEYVRIGDIDLAIDMCRQSDQSWRAASLRGGTLYSDPFLNSLKSYRGDAMADDDQNPLPSDRTTPSGNVNRTLWKAMCRKIASNVGRSPFSFVKELIYRVELGRQVRTSALRCPGR